jgi:threonine/homoserine/homoserine lactone efflux protein
VRNGSEAYLCWIGWKLLRVSVADQSTDMALAQQDWAYFRQALAVSLTNPKVIMFFSSSDLGRLDRVKYKTDIKLCSVKMP